MDNVVLENKLPLVNYMLMLIGNSILTFSYLLLGLFILYAIYRVIVKTVKNKDDFKTEKFKEDVECSMCINNNVNDDYTKVTYIFKNETVELINKLAINEKLYVEALIEKIVKRYSKEILDGK